MNIYLERRRQRLVTIGVQCELDAIEASKLDSEREALLSKVAFDPALY